jgi:hypothetical protein
MFENQQAVTIEDRTRRAMLTIKARKRIKTDDALIEAALLFYEWATDHEAKGYRIGLIKPDGTVQKTLIAIP